MRKRDDGYILIYVVVVILVLCILASSICTSVVRNLNAQSHAIEHMKYVYEAEGVGERFVSELQKAARFKPDSDEAQVYSVADSETGANERHREAAQILLSNALPTALEHAVAYGAMKDDVIQLLTQAGGVIKEDEYHIFGDFGNYNESTGCVTSDLRFWIVSGDSSVDSTIHIEMYMGMENDTENGCFHYSIERFTYNYTNYQLGSAPGGS